MWIATALATQDRPPRARRAQAEEADQVGPVGVVVERDAAELVAAHRRIVDRLALVGDVAQHVAVLVLRPGLAEVQADAPVEQCEVVVAVAGGVERGDAREPASVQQRVHDAVELGGQLIEREVVAVELQRVGALLLRRREGGMELGLVVGGQAQRPLGGIGDVGGPPLGCGLELVQCRVGLHAGLLSSAAAGVSRPPRTRRPGRAPVGSPSRYVIAAGDDGGAVAVGALQQALAPGGQVVGHDRRRAGQVVEVDDVEVGPHAGGQDPTVVEADGRRGGAGQLLDDLSHRHAAAGPVTGPVGEGVGREAGVGDEADVGAAVAQARRG